MKQEETLCDKVEALWEFIYLHDRVSAGGKCVAAMTARTRCGWVTYRECGELLYSRRFPLKLEKGLFIGVI